MSRNTVNRGQSFFNKVIELTGDIDNSFEMMLLNETKSITDTLNIGSKIKASAVTDNDVMRFFNEFKKPANAIVIVPIQIEELEYELPGEFPYSF